MTEEREIILNHYAAKCGIGECEIKFGYSNFKNDYSEMLENYINILESSGIDEVHRIASIKLFYKLLKKVQESYAFKIVPKQKLNLRE